MVGLPSWLNPFKKKEEAPAPLKTGAASPTPKSKPQAPKAEPLADVPNEEAALKGLEGAPRGLKAFFYRKWKDPAFIKEIKTLAGYMQRDGVNIRDMGAVKAWLEKNEQGIKDGRFKEPLSSTGKPVTYEKTGPELGRNDPCHCGSGKKYKKCHGLTAGERVQG